MVKGYIHSIESMGTLDGPGIRTVVFMQGCPLRCRYCHNPDTWEVKGGTEYTADELFNKVIRYKEYYGQDGGVTVSGGEPLLQTEFLIEFFGKLKAAGINTVIDTAGSILNKNVKVLCKSADLIILDIKNTENREYDALCGLKSDTDMYDKVIAFLEYLNTQNKRVWLRQIIIPGINDTKEQVLRLKAIADKYKVEKTELLAYHMMGIEKWEKLGLEYSLKGVKPPSEKKMAELRKLIE